MKQQLKEIATHKASVWGGIATMATTALIGVYQTQVAPMKDKLSDKVVEVQNLQRAYLEMSEFISDQQEEIIINQHIFLMLRYGSVRVDSIRKELTKTRFWEHNK